MYKKERLNYLDFDIYSRRISFFYNNKEKFGSPFGFILTISYITFSLSIFLFYFMKTVKREQVTFAGSEIYSKEIPSININKDIFYISFGLIDANKSSRFIDERVYYPEVLYIEKIKNENDFNYTKKVLNIERCDNSKFGEEYQNLLNNEDLSNSYCLKDLNLTLKGGYNYDRMNYIKINIYPCINKTGNNNCRPQKEIDKYLSSSYFSILFKDIGYSPFNYSFPTLPILQHLHTAIDKSLLKEYLIYFGITEINTDVGLFSNSIKKEIYLKYIRDFYSFFISDNEDYLSGREIFTSQIMLEDHLYFQKRTFTKMSEVFSSTGGYMQFLYTVFALVALLTKKFSLEQKLLNSLFNFNIKQKKVILCIEYKKRMDYNSSVEGGNKNENTFFPYEAKKSIVSRRSRRQSVLILNNMQRCGTMQNPNLSIMKSIKSKSKRESQSLAISIHSNNSPSLFKRLPREKEENEDKEEKSQNFNLIDQNINRSKMNMIFKENLDEKKRKSNFNILNDLKSLDKGGRSTVNFNIFDYYCLRNINNKKTEIELFNFGINFFKSQMDIINFFNIIILTQIMLNQQSDKKQNFLTRTIELQMK